MASKHALVSQNQQIGKEGKKKIGQAEGRNRKVLRDIGNVVTIPAIIEKAQIPINRPITRGYCAQLLAKADADKNPKVQQAKAAVRTKKVSESTVLTIGPDDVKPKIKDAAVAAAAAVITTTKVSESTVITVGPDDVKQEIKDAAVAAAAAPITTIIANKEEGKSGIGSSKKKTNKALTSILTARSKAACGILNKPKSAIANIDESDVDDELAVVEYVEDIYKFYSEDECKIDNYMGSQPDISPKMRSILIDWLVEVHRKFELTPETIYLTINIVDRYLSVKTVPRRELQLLGISAMLIASKYEEIWAVEVSEFIAICDNAYVRREVLVMEKAILGKLGWYLTVPTPYVFLVRYIKASSAPSDDDQMENMVFFLAELGMMNYSTVITYCPSKIAASAVYAARCTLHKTPLWTDTLKYHTGYSQDQLRDCAKELASYHAGAAESRLRAVYKKFSYPERGSVSLYPPLLSSSLLYTYI